MSEDVVKFFVWVLVMLLATLFFVVIAKLQDSPDIENTKGRNRKKKKRRKNG